jgi:hypothetical protein
MTVALPNSTVDASAKATAPNVFDFATSELSQDAFICWLVRWADPQFSIDNPSLHAQGTRFVQALVERSGRSCPAISSVRPVRQWNKIDVVIEVNEDLLIVIEDKTFTSEGPQQLERYREAIADYPHPSGGSWGDPVLLYYKIGNEPDDGSGMRGAFHRFNRGHILEALDGASAHPLVADYRIHVQRIEAGTTAFMTEPIQTWLRDWRAVEGFYYWLQSQLTSSWWDHASNPDGGVRWFAWHETELPLAEHAYLQLMGAARLEVRLSTRDESKVTKDARYALLRELERVARSDVGIRFDIAKSGKYQPGRTGGVATLSIPGTGTILVTDEDGRLDRQRTLDALRAAEVILDQACAAASA